jgi:hypothetical protein
VLGTGVDLAVGFLCLIGCIVCFAVGGKSLGSVALVAAAFAAVLQFHSWATQGQTLGWAVAGIRQVTETDGAPFGLGRLLPRQPSWLADIRRGHDPVAPTLLIPALHPDQRFRREPEPWAPSFPVPPLLHAEPQFAEHTVAAWPAGLARAAHPEFVEDVDETRLRVGRMDARRFLVINGQTRCPLGPRVLIGRSPAAGAHDTAVAVADLSRLMSKTHLLIETTPEGTIFVTDLGSTNGTMLETTRSADPLRLPALARTELDVSSVLRIGEHMLSFAAAGSVTASSARA